MTATKTPATEKTPKVAKPAKTPKTVAEKTKPRDRAMAKVPAADRRREFVKILRKLGAISPQSARPISVVATKLGYSSYDVYCLAYHNFPLAKAGVVKTATIEDSRENGVYLTKKGAEIALDDLP